jgi:hypothetical protein
MRSTAVVLKLWVSRFESRGAVINCGGPLCSITVNFPLGRWRLRSRFLEFAHELDVRTLFEPRHCAEWSTLTSNSNGAITTLHTETRPGLFHLRADMFRSTPQQRTRYLISHCTSSRNFGNFLTAHRMIRVKRFQGYVINSTWDTKEEGPMYPTRCPVRWFVLSLYCKMRTESHDCGTSGAGSY